MNRRAPSAVLLATLLTAIGAPVAADTLRLGLPSGDQAPPPSERARVSVSEEPAPAPPPPRWVESTRVFEVLLELGAERPAHWVEPDEALVQRGRELLTEGRSVGADGRMSRRQSRFFVCTDCHNLEREDPDLGVSAPETRLDWAVAYDQPFLPATTLYGMVDRSSWFNDDYVLKYGEGIRPANESLREALQLCSTECSQGRRLSDEELDALLAWGWSESLRLGDLGLAAEDWARLYRAESDPAGDPGLLEWLQGRYLSGSPATFAHPPEDRVAGYGLEGDPARGQVVFERACLTCHGRGGPARYRMASSRAKLRELARYITRNHRFSIYHGIREGTEAKPGARAYMPRYSLEHMSDQQIEDLRAYIEQGAAR